MRKPRTKTAPRMNSCSSCGSPVRARRPSRSGEHFCPKPDCQADKRRYYRSHSINPVPEGPEELTNVCSHCGGPVRARRSSATGEHFCPKPDCRKAANRFYRSRITMTAEGLRERADREKQRLELLGAALHDPRSDCDGCGATGVLPGWIHRKAPTYVEPCLFLGNKGFAAGPKWIDTVWPELIP